MKRVNSATFVRPPSLRSLCSCEIRLVARRAPNGLMSSRSLIIGFTAARLAAFVNGVLRPPRVYTASLCVPCVGHLYSGASAAAASIPRSSRLPAAGWSPPRRLKPATAAAPSPSSKWGKEKKNRAQWGKRTEMINRQRYEPMGTAAVAFFRVLTEDAPEPILLVWIPCLSFQTSERCCCL